jgi:predicted dehydrogenase
LGWIAGLFAREVQSAGGVIRAVGSRSLDKALEFQNLYGSGRYGLNRNQIPGGVQNDGGATIPKAFGSYEEVIADPEVDVIYIATPHSEHQFWALKCLEAGKPILVEKAFTQNLEQAQRVFDLAKQRKLFVMEAYWTRFLHHIKRIKSLVDQGEIGEIVAIFADHGQAFPYDPEFRLFDPKKAGGGLLDLGIYPISLTHYLLGKPDSITAKGVAAPSGVDANLAMILEYGQGAGAQAILHCTSLAGTPTTASICGTKGRIEIYRQFYRPTDFKITYNDGSVYNYVGKKEELEWNGDDGNYGMHFEAGEVQRCLANHQLESEIMPWSATLDCMEIMDEVRRQIGLVLAGD